MSRLLPLLFVGVFASLVATPAFGQLRPERPYRGLFGGVGGDMGQVLTANASLGGGYDDNLLAEASGRGPSVGTVSPLTDPGGTFGNFSGSLGYSVNDARHALTASAGTSSRYYPEGPTNFVAAHHAGLGAMWRLGTRTSLSASGNAIYQPFTFASLFPTTLAQVLPATPDLVMAAEIANPVELPDLDQAAGSGEYFGYGAQASLSHQLTRRTTAMFGAGAHNRASGTSFTGPSRQRSANAGIRYSVSRDLGLRLGYGVALRTDGGDGERRQNAIHNLDVGIDFNRALSFSRRTTVSFSTGTSAYAHHAGLWQFRATGGAQINHEIGRTWSASAGYNRAIRFVDTLYEPLFSDSVSVSLGGLATRRVQIRSAAHASIGSQGQGNYDTYYTSLGVQLALNRHMSLGTNYSYFWYEFDDRVVLPPGVPRSVERQSVTALVSLWAPIFQRARRPDATR